MAYVRKTPLHYPVVDAAVKAHGGIRQFSRTTGVAIPTYYSFQQGKCDPQKFTIDAILRFTGLTYEEAFREK